MDSGACAKTFEKPWYTHSTNQGCGTGSQFQAPVPAPSNQNCLDFGSTALVVTLGLLTTMFSARLPSLSLSALPQLSTTSQPGAQRSYKKSRRKPEQIYSMQVNNDSLKSTPVELLPIAYGIEPTERRRDKSIPRLHERASKTPSHIDPSPSPSYNTQQPRPTTAHEIPFHSVYTITNKKLSKPHQKYGPQPRGAFTGIKPVPICTTTVYSCQPSSRTHLSAIPPYQSRFYTVASDLVVVLIYSILCTTLDCLSLSRESWVCGELQTAVYGLAWSNVGMKGSMATVDEEFGNWLHKTNYLCYLTSLLRCFISPSFLSLVTECFCLHLYLYYI